MTHTEAYKIGREARGFDWPCVPAFDPAIVEHMRGRKPGESEPILRAWLEGWHDRNIEIGEDD